MEGVSWIVPLFIALICGILVGQDAAKRGMSSWGWGIFVFLICIIGLPMYLIMRKPLVSGIAGPGQIAVSTESATKKCPYCAEIIKVEAKLCRYCGKDQSIENPENPKEIVVTSVKYPSKEKFRVKIKGPDDPQKVYLITKEFCKDVGVNFEKAKGFLSSGTTCNFENKDEALKFVDKYKEMGCEVELKGD